MADRRPRRDPQPALDGLGDDATHAGDERAVPGFRGPQVCKIVGISYRQLDYWARTDLVRPSIADAKGSGTQRDSYRYLVLKAAQQPSTCAQAADRVQGDPVPARGPRRRLGRPRLVGNGSNSGAGAHRRRQPIDLVRHGQGVLNIVPLGHVMDELDADVREHATGRLDASHGAVAATSRCASRQPERQFGQAARLLRDRMGLRAAHVRPRARPRRQPHAGVHSRLLPAGVRRLHRDHHAQARSSSPRRTARPVACRSSIPTCG